MTIRQTLLELELISHGTTTNTDSSSHGKASSRPPAPLLEEPPHLHYRRLWARAHTDTQRNQVLAEARAALTRARYAPKRVDSATKAGRLAIGLDERPATIVAEVHGVSTGHVYRCRREVATALGNELDQVRRRMAA